jgi:hypothetical protein
MVAASISSIEYEMHMAVAIASVGRLVVMLAVFVTSISDGIRLENPNQYVMKMVSRKAGRRSWFFIEVLREVATTHIWTIG